MDDFIGHFNRIVGLSPINLLLLSCVFWLVRERFAEYREGWTVAEQKIERLERSLLVAGISLHELED